MKKKTRAERQFERELREAIRISREESLSNRKSSENEKTDNYKSDDDDSEKSKNDFFKESSDDKSDSGINEEEIANDDKQIDMKISDQNNENQKKELLQNFQISNKLPIPLVNKQISQENENEIQVNDDRADNPLFVEFEIKAPTPKPNSPRMFLNKKSSNPQLPSSVNSLYSSTTSSTNSDDDDKTSASNQKKKKIPQINTFKSLAVKTQNREDSYFDLEDEKDSFDYNDVEVDEIDKDKTNTTTPTEINPPQIPQSIPQSQQQILNLQRLNQLSSINQNQSFSNPIQKVPRPIQKVSQPISNASQQIQNQNFISYIQNRFDTSKINDPKLISAFLYLDEYEEKKKKENLTKKEEKKKKIELTHDGIPFYSYDPSKDDERSSISFPTEPIKPSHKTSATSMNMMFGIGDDLNGDEQNYGDYGFRNDFVLQMEEENDFHIKIKSIQNFNEKRQNPQNSFSFEIAPYLQEQIQQHEIEKESIVENKSISKENDMHSKFSNDENESENNEDEKSMKINDKGRSRYYQQNDEFDSDNDYDFEVSEVKSEPYKNKESFDYSALKKPKQVQLNVAEFESVPFHPMNSEDFYSLMMNSMTYDEKKFQNNIYD